MVSRLRHRRRRTLSSLLSSRRRELAVGATFLPFILNSLDSLRHICIVCFLVLRAPSRSRLFFSDPGSYAVHRKLDWREETPVNIVDEKNFGRK